MAKGYILDLISDVVQTTDGSTVSIATLPVPGTGQMMRVTYTSVAKSGNNMRSCVRTGIFRNIGGTITVLGSIGDILAPQADAALATAGCTLAVVTNVPYIRVTGVALTTIDWYANYHCETFY